MLSWNFYPEIFILKCIPVSELSSPTRERLSCDKIKTPNLILQKAFLKARRWSDKLRSHTSCYNSFVFFVELFKRLPQWPKAVLHRMSKRLKRTTNWSARLLAEKNTRKAERTLRFWSRRNRGNLGSLSFERSRRKSQSSTRTKRSTAYPRVIWISDLRPLCRPLTNHSKHLMLPDVLVKPVHLSRQSSERMDHGSADSWCSICWSMASVRFTIMESFSSRPSPISGVPTWLRWTIWEALTIYQKKILSRSHYLKRARLLPA